MNLVRLLPRFRKAYRELDELAARGRWSRTEIETWQLERVNAVWKHAITRTPYYRRQRERLDLPDRFVSLQEFSAAVPIVRRSALKDDSRSFLSETPQPGDWHVSSGSTGSPTRFYWGHEAHLEALRHQYRLHADWGVDIFDRKVMLWGNGAEHTPGCAGVWARLRRRLEDRLRNRLRLSAYHLDPVHLRAHLRQLTRFRPVMFYAYSTAAFLLAQEAERQRFHCDSLKVCSLSAEPVFPHIVAAVERAFGVPAAVEYGATECPVIAGEGPDRTLRVCEDLVFVETVPDGLGRQEIVLTVLGNPSFPLIRYAIGDVTTAPLEVPPRGFAVLKNVSGRQNEFLFTRSGRILHPLRFDFLFGFNLAEAVRRYRIHQGADGAVSVAVEVNRPIARHDTVHLERELDDLLEGYPVTLNIVSALPQTAHKHFWTTSELAGRRENG
jgi:phenylacetate-CoA ligase